MISCEEIRDQLPLYAVGALEEASCNEVRAHLADCSACRSNFEELRDVVALLPHQLPNVAPSADLKRRLFQRISSPSHESARRLFDFSSLPWQNSDMPGVSFFWLRPPADNGATAALVKIQPGSIFLDHRHVGSEDCLVLQGHLRDGRGEYHAGDYVFYEAGSVQREIQALQGEECILFLVNQLGIEFL